MADELRRGRPALGRAGQPLALEPARGAGRVPRLLAQRLRLQPVAAPQLQGRGDHDAARLHRRPRARGRGRLGRGCQDRARGAAGAAPALPAAAARAPADRPRPMRAQGLAAGRRNPDKVAYLAFTSGTTGVPKAVMHSDNTLLANCRDLVRDWRHDHTTVLLTLSPLSHHIAWVAAGQALTAGMELVVDDPPRRHEPARLADRDRRHLRHGRADPRDGHPGRAAPARHRAPRRGAAVLHGGRADPAARSPSAFSSWASSRRTSTA